MRPLALVFSLLLMAPGLIAEDFNSIVVRRMAVTADYVGSANLVVADIDGDGRGDVVSCSRGAPFVVAGNEYTFQTIWQGPPMDCAGVTAGDRDGNGSVEVITVSSFSSTTSTPGQVAIFDIRNLTSPVASVDLPGVESGVDIAFGNVDSDPGMEIIALTSGNMYVYNAATLALKWQATGYGGKKVGLGDVNGDGRLDIVVNGSTGWALDAQKRSEIFGYLGGFGSTMAVGDIDADNKAEILFVTSWSSTVTILHGDTMQINSVTGNSVAIDRVTFGDANHDGVVEIITGNNQWGYIEGHRVSDGFKLWSIRNPEHGVQGIVAGDVTGDGIEDVIWGAGATSSAEDVLFIGDAVAQSIRWQNEDLDGPFSSTAADLNGDGRIEHIVAAGSTNNSYNGGLIRVFDRSFSSPDVLNAGPSKTIYPNSRIQRVVAGQLDSDAPLEIAALTGSYSYDSRIMVWDGKTGALEFTGVTPQPSFVQNAIVVADVDHDLIDEIIVAQTDSKVIVLSGASNFIENTIFVNGSISDLAIANLDVDDALELIVSTSTYIYAYDTSTWTIDGQVAASYIARVVASSATGAVAASTGSGDLTLYQGASLTPVWSCSRSALSASYNTLALAFQKIGTSTRLLAGDSGGRIRVLPLTGTSCPAFTTKAISKGTIARLASVEATDDSRPDLLVDTSFGSELLLIGATTETRGDVTGDGQIDAFDIELVIDYLFGKAAGIAPAADANADDRVGVEDAFKLIRYYYSGGEAPPE